MKEEKWLLRKTSGSRSRFKSGGDYKDDKIPNLDLLNELPMREGLKKTSNYLDSGLIKKWLHNYIGKDFDYIYSEYLKRIQPKYLADYKDEIYLYAEARANVSFDQDGNVCGRWAGKIVKLPSNVHSSFYVDPETNLLKKIPEGQFKKRLLLMLIV